MAIIKQTHISINITYLLRSCWGIASKNGLIISTPGE